MAKKIHKFTFGDSAHKYIYLPIGAEIIHVHGQFGDVAVWFSFDNDVALNEGRDFYIVGTGQEFANDMVHHGTAHIDGFVWHVMEQK